MRIRAVNVLNGGEILAEPVVTEKNEILIPKGTVLKEEYIPLIKSLGVESLMLEDPYENYEDPNPIIVSSRLDKYVEKVRRLMEGHIYHGASKSLKEFEIIANDIVREIDELPLDGIIDIKERNANLYDHTVMVTLLSVMVAKKLKLDNKKKYNIAVGCLLHDIGIRYITVQYENRNFDNAEPVELFEYKKHTILGYSALEDESWIPPISMKMILCHHENMNGTGFPMKQKNKEIECKIIQACDAFDCFISGMECRRMSIQQALEYLVEGTDIFYDRRIVRAIERLVARYPVGTRVRLNTGESGIVLKQTENSIRPVIRILDEENRLTEKVYQLNKNKNVSILQVEN